MKTLKIVSWNLGYAGLGCHNEFAFDKQGFGRIRPISKDDVENSLSEQIKILLDIDADVILVQEVTKMSFLNYGVNMLDALSKQLKQYRYSCFYADLNHTFPRMIHGNAIFSKTKFSHKVINLPYKKFHLTKLINQRYNAIVGEFVFNGKEINIINTHLSAFDSHAITRDYQMNYLLNNLDIDKLNIIGGDFNMSPVSLDQFSRPNKFSFWVTKVNQSIEANIKQHQLKEIFDDKIPTVRTNEKQFDGSNYQTVTDFFVGSKSIEVVSIKNINLDFRYSDHNPVVLEVNI